MSELVLKRFPFLKGHLPIRCLCGATMEINGEYLDETLNGITTAVCESCGAPGATLTTYRDKKEMAKIACLLRGRPKGSEGEG